MGTILENGVGDGNKALIDPNNQLHVFSQTRTTTQQATSIGNSYNINTGNIGLTSTTASGVLYFKNEESPVNGESSFVVDSIAIGIDNAGTTASMANIVVVRNPTGGTLISGASDVEMNQNRNFGSSNSLDSVVYKGVEGNTVTGGQDIALFYQASGSRGVYSVDFEMPKGSSIAITIDTQTTSGTTNVYAELIGHRVDGKNI